MSRPLHAAPRRETLVRPVPLDGRQRWAALPLPSESVLGGADGLRIDVEVDEFPEGDPRGVAHAVLAAAIGRSRGGGR